MSASWSAIRTLAGRRTSRCEPALPKTFTYLWQIGPYLDCGTHTVDNIASFVTNGTGTTGSDTETVTVNMPCVGGCTLTPSYWKPHSMYGPARYDETWAQVGEDTPFFKSGVSYYTAL